MSIVRINNLGITDGTIVNADIATAAAIATTKIGAGAVLQVVYGETATTVNMSSTTLTDTGLSASITPSSASNKILVLVNQNGVRKGSNNANNDVKIIILRNSTQIASPSVFALYTGTAIELYGATISASYLDSPNTTSSITYKTQFSNPDGGGSAGTVTTQIGSALSNIVLLEIKG